MQTKFSQLGGTGWPFICCQLIYPNELPNIGVTMNCNVALSKLLNDTTTRWPDDDVRVSYQLLLHPLCVGQRAHQFLRALAYLSRLSQR